ncbi:Subunit of the glycosylphosphatidylinositol transamidase complex-like protein, partial [Kickxella alabastrina]
IELEFDSMGAKESPLPVLGVHRHVTGHGGSSGGVEAVIVNRGDRAVDVTYMDTLPWYLRVYSHTLEIHTQRGGEGAADAGAGAERLVPSRLLFSPAVDRGQPSTMELALKLGPQSRTTLRYSFDKGFLKYTEHPPDANRGFNIGPAIVSYTSDAGGGRQQPLYCAIGATLLLADNTTAVDGGGGGGGGCVVRAYSELFLASLPTPDFSMPYNVITFTCTILALFFGRIFNLLTRDFAVLNDEKAGKEEGDGVAVEVK